MFQYGEIVKVRAFIDGIVTRRVVEEAHGTVYLCTENEFESAQKENREPIAMGFPIEDVVDRQPVSETVH